MKKLLLTIFTTLVVMAWVPAQATEGAASAPSTESTSAQGPPLSVESILDYMDPSKLLPAEKSMFSTLFGDFVLDKEGQGHTTVLTRIIGFTAVGALMLGIITVTYVIIGGAVNTATSGEPLGRNWSSVWLPLRISIGFGMITPAAAGGGVLSAIQILVLKMAIFGSAIGSAGWGFATDDIISYDSSVTQAVQAPKLDSYVDLANSAICSVQEKARVDEIGASKFARPHYSMSIYLADGTSQKIVSRSAPGADSFKLPAGAVIGRIDFSTSGLCGRMNMFPKKTDKVPAGAWAAYQNVSQEISKTLNYYTQLAVMVNKDGMGNAIIEIAQKREVEGGDKVREYVAKVQVAIAAHAANYPKAMVDAIENGFKSSVKNVAEEKSKVMAYNEWIFAGNHAFQMSNYSSAKGAAAQVVGQAISNGAWRACGQGVAGCAAGSNKRVEAAHGEESVSSIVGWMSVVEEAVGSAVIQKSPGVNPETAGIVCEEKGCSASKWVKDLTNDLHVTLLDGISGMGSFTSGEKTNTIRTSVFDVSGNSNPYLVSANIGHGLNAVLAGAWTTGLVATAAAGAAKGNQVASFFGAGAGSAAIEYVLAFVVPMFFAAFFAGAVMAYVIPSIIAMRFLFAVLDWILMVIEALTAAPLWIIMMTTPEGEGISGARGERGLILISQVILTPLLLIIALFAAIAIGNIGFQLLNIMWFADPTAYNNNGLFDFVYRLLIWVTLLTSICWFAATPINTLPKAILDWMGGGMARAMDNQAEQQVTGITKKAEGVANQAASAGGSVLRKRLGMP